MQLGIHDNEKLHNIIRSFEQSSLRTRFLNANKVGGATTSSGNEFQVPKRFTYGNIETQCNVPKFTFT